LRIGTINHFAAILGPFSVNHYARWQNGNTDKQAKVQAQGDEHQGPKMISSGVTLQLKDTSSNEKNFTPWL
jgi:hypothetical protein